MSLPYLADGDRWFNFLAHGDADHREWLREAILAYIENKPRPEPRGLGTKEARIAELEREVSDLRRRVDQPVPTDALHARDGLPPRRKP